LHSIFAPCDETAKSPAQTATELCSFAQFAFAGANAAADKAIRFAFECCHATFVVPADGTGFVAPAAEELPAPSDHRPKQNTPLLHRSSSFGKNLTRALSQIRPAPVNSKPSLRSEAS